MKKKILSTLLCATLVFSMTACGVSAPETGSTSDSSTTTADTSSSTDASTATDSTSTTTADTTVRKVSAISSLLMKLLELSHLQV